MSDPTRILFVEDDDDIREIAMIALETLGGFEVRQCSSGIEALEKVVGFDPDLFLLDVMMPQMSGQETLAALRAIPEFAGVPAVFMTAKVRPEEIDVFKSWGAIGVIAKPFNVATLADEVQAMLA